MPALANLVRVLSSTTSTGTLTLGSAVQGFLTPTQAGMIDGGIYSYAIEADYTTVGDDLVPTSRECGYGTYASGAGTLTRNIYNSTNSNALLNLTGDEQVIIADLTSSHRERLTGDRSYYVRADGSDSNSGNANTSGAAWLTWQKAYDYICADLDLSGYTVTVNVAAGTFTSSPGLMIEKSWTGGGTILFSGAGDTTVIDLSAGSGLFLNGGGTLPGILSFQNFLITLGSGHGFWWSGFGNINILGGVNFSTCPNGTPYRAEGNGASILVGGNWSHGDASIVFWCNLGAKIQVENGVITLSAAGSWGNSYAQGDSSGIIRIGSTFTANAAFTASTGLKYFLTKNMVLSVGSGTANAYIPGSTNGSALSGSQSD